MMSTLQNAAAKSADTCLRKASALLCRAAISLLEMAYVPSKIRRCTSGLALASQKTTIITKSAYPNLRERSRAYEDARLSQSSAAASASSPKVAPLYRARLLQKSVRLQTTHSSGQTLQPLLGQARNTLRAQVPCSAARCQPRCAQPGVDAPRCAATPARTGESA
jgi:hypothetical protein